MSVETQIQIVIHNIEERGDPVLMTKTEWKEFLEGIISECETRLEAVKMELTEGEDGAEET